eukprot:TRINITY_DN101525_c0_g1_i1.p1 TRINITY_DN101525_c0_g1~~TRINITY_DN101525_c0_g1_i1.p1  ORF type:complete len:345 (+),score=62.22 TRINITY_DN101525_c0_g1_i1:106-1140(+)
MTMLPSAPEAAAVPLRPFAQKVPAHGAVAADKGSVENLKSGQKQAVEAVLFYVVTSTLMMVANKKAVIEIKAGTVLVAAQMVATCLFALGMHVTGLCKLRGNFADAVRWAPTGLLFGVILWTGIMSVKYASLSTITVVRNASPMALLIGEWAVFGLRPSKEMVLSLLLLLCGVCMYVYSDTSMIGSETRTLGMLFIAADVVFVCLDRLLERYLLAHKPVQLSATALVLVSNSVGCLAVLFSLYFGLCGEEGHEIQLRSFPAYAWGCTSLFCGAAIAFASVQLARSVSATTALVVSNVDKVLVLSYGVLCMGDKFDAPRALGCFVALLGGSWHLLERSRCAAQGD